MTDDTGAAGTTAFQKSIQACLVDLDAMLPELMERYDSTIVIRAMAEHVGSALQILRRRKLCNDRQTALILERLERWLLDP